MTELFYVFGGILTAVALVLSFIGLRAEGFPTSRGLFAGVLGGLVLLVVASCGFAIALAREEADHREHEIAEFEAEEQAEAAEETGAEEAAEDPADEEPVVESEPPAGDTLQLTSPPEGDLVFEPTALAAGAGEVTIDYTNPSEVPHNVAIEADGEELAQGPTVTGGDSGPASATLEPGEYVFFCSIPGHREAGMEGTLTVE